MAGEGETSLHRSADAKPRSGPAGSADTLANSVLHDTGFDDIGQAAAPASTRAVVGRAALVILAATVVGRLLGLVRDMAVAYFFGAQQSADAFFLAYKLPYLLSLTVGGALTATFIPVFTHRLVLGRREEAWRLSVSMANAVAVILIALTAVCIVLGPWLVPLFGPGFDRATRELAVDLFRILMPGVIFGGLAGLAIGILNSLKRFGLAAFSPAAAAATTIAFIALLSSSWGITSLAVGTTAGALVSLVVLFPQLRHHGMRYSPRLDWRLPGMAEVAVMVWPILIGSAVGKVSVFVDQVLGSLLEVGSISALNYSEKLFQLPLGLFVAGITVPIFPLLSEHVAAGEPERLKATLNFGLRLIAFVMIPASVGLIVLRYPIIALLFERGKFGSADTARTASALLMFSLGLFSYAGRDTLTRVFYAYHDTKTPVKISVAAVALNIGASYVLMHFLGVGGLALGTTIALTVNMLVLMELLRRKLGSMGFGRLVRAVGGVLAAALVMGAVVWGLDLALSRALPAGELAEAVRVAAGVVIGAGVFVGASALVRLPELREVREVVRASLGGGRQEKRGTGRI